jgi:hypothetical protein
MLSTILLAQVTTLDPSKIETRNDKPLSNNEKSSWVGGGFEKSFSLETKFSKK